MNLLLELILLWIVLQSRPGAYGQEKPDGYYNTFKGGWDRRYSLPGRAAFTGRGGTCYGLTGVQDPHWLGNTDYLNNDALSRSLELKDTEPANFGYNLDLGNRSELKVTGIMANGKPLYGWFHLQLVAKGRFPLVLDQVYAHVETENDFFAPAGSFVRTKFGKGSTCGTLNAEDKYDYKPCQWAQDPFMLAHNTFLKRQPFGKALKIYEWNVRIEFPLCFIYHSGNPLYFRILATQREQFNFFHMPLQQWIYLENFNFGAPDPEPPSNAKVDCTMDVNNLTWVKNTADLSKKVSWWRTDCSTESLGYYNPPKVPQYNWGGRCCIGFSPQYSQKAPYLVPRITHKYNCRTTSTQYKYSSTTPAVWENYKAPPAVWPKGLVDNEINEYVKESLGEYTKKCKTDPKCKKANANVNGISAGSTIGHYIYAGRQGHAFLMAIACFFVYPLTNFITRYCKGTFMSTRYIVNLHPWYAAHIYGTLTTFTLLVTGVGMGIYARYYLGYSFHPAGRTHVALGYITCFLFLGGMITNGLRHGMKPSRNYSIILHACFGVVFYYLALVTIAVAVWIPACPGGQKFSKTTGEAVLNITLIVVTILFPIFEIVIHVVGTMQLYKGDKRYSVGRDWAGFVAIPWVTSEDLDDEAGTELKKLLFIVYVVGASIATVIVLVTVGTSKPAGHFFGPMTYTHSRGKLSVQDVQTHVETEDLI